MYDFNKADLLGASINAILNNSHLEFIADCNINTGEVNEKKKIAKYLGIDNFCTIINDEYVNFKFSFHKYFNAGQHNHNDFAISDFVEVLIDLSERFEINPFYTTLHNLEFGVNVELPFSTKVFLKAIIAYKGAEYKKETYNARGYLLRFEFQQYELKIYDKGLQYHLGKNIIRFEIKVIKMQYLKSKGIYVNTYSDLLERKNITKLVGLLCKAFNELMIYDESINLKSTKSNREREILLNGKNPKYWHELNSKNANTFKKKRKIFRELVLKYGKAKIQSQVFELLQEKLKTITEITSTTQKIITDYLLKFNSKSVPKITDLLATNKKSKCTRITPSSIGLKEYPIKQYCIASEINFLK